MKLPAILILVVITLASCSKVNTGHACRWKTCPFKGDVVFTSGCGYCEQGTDCWILDSLHFVSPSLEYDQLEYKLFSPMQPTKLTKYINDLIEDGYSLKWATHKAKVELLMIPRDSLYDAIEQD